MNELLIKALIAYLLGSIVGSLLVGRLRGGVDIRRMGSGNAGGTNALRTQGKAFAIWVLLIDVGKGWVATRWLGGVSLPGIAPAPGLREWVPAVCGVAAVIGHVYPLWHGFRGGKGVATLVGAVLGINFWLFVGMLATWLLAVSLSGFVGLGSMTAAAVLPALVFLMGAEPRAPLLVFGAAMAVIIVFTHRSNIARMRAHTEPRARRMWLLGHGRT
ncbi:MAG TPA: glycerol-3-phosphate 1-O-acyltransferase PlsY [Steroidobacteraceae bacterium]|nr:glycerol-3-phosphate 1-O-acyltransferase PlsY [Steroidobacteraceae bacterium]